jgi:hypothetical protein
MSIKTRMATIMMNKVSRVSNFRISLLVSKAE